MNGDGSDGHHSNSYFYNTLSVYLYGRAEDEAGAGSTMAKGPSVTIKTMPECESVCVMALLATNTLRRMKYAFLKWPFLSTLFCWSPKQIEVFKLYNGPRQPRLIYRGRVLLYSYICLLSRPMTRTTYRKRWPAGRPLSQAIVF